MRHRLLRISTLAVGVLSVLILLNPMSARAETSPAEVTAVSGPNGKVALYNELTVQVANLSEYLKQPGKSPEKFILYLDSRPLKGVHPRLAGENTLIFDIKRTPESKDQWNALLGRPFFGRKGFLYPVRVSIGYEEEKPIRSTIDYPLVVVNKIGFWVFIVAFAISLYAFVWLARHKGIIRDPCPDLPPEQRPYSLGRTQMAFWFFVIAACYVLIWMITSDRDSLTASELTLLGISTATALGAAVVGSSKSSADESKKQALELERATLEKRLTQFASERAVQPLDKLSALNQEEAEKTARLDQVKKELADLSRQAAPQKSAGFKTDILSDAEGISIHRFQIAIWTIVLGVIFVAAVFNSLAMPEFSGTLLALMGISGGTYIGFKFPEKQG